MPKNAYVSSRNLARKAALWKKAIRPYERHPYRIAQESTALLIIDVQKYFTRPGSHAYLPAARTVLPNISRILKKFTERNLTAVCTRHSHRKGEQGILGVWWKDTIREGSEDSELDERLDTQGALILRKTRYSAFSGTRLDEILSEKHMKTLVIAGVMTDLCCLGTAVTAFVNDFQVVILLDATATADEQLHLSALRTLAHGYAEILDCRELERRLGWADE